MDQNFAHVPQSHGLQQQQQALMQQQAAMTGGPSGFQTQISFSQTQDIGSTKLQYQQSAPMQMPSGGARDSQEFGGKRIGGKGGARIKVAVRIRPLLDSETNQGHQSSCVRVAEANHTVQINPPNEAQGGQMNATGGVSARQRNFQFDQVFSPNRKQTEVYEGLGISKLINRVVDGYHGTIFAYGQTGSGKTHTMEGRDVRQGATSPRDQAAPNEEDIGITQRGIHQLFKRIEEMKAADSTRHYSVFVSFLQIYNEKVFDLLNPQIVQGVGGKRGNSIEGQAGLRIRWTKKDQFVVENLYVFETAAPQEVLDLYKYGARNRILASHNLNDFSSRSHSIFSLTIESQDLRDPVNVTVSKLQLVDLAGSEKQSLTGTTGQQAKESIDINKSLHVLRKVITALTESQSNGQKGGRNVVPYRESKLTCLLKQSLGGNSYTLMVACLSPSDKYFEENLSTLNYASRASQISNLPTKNIDPKMVIMNEQKRKIIDLDKELRNANMHIQNLSLLNNDKDLTIEKLQKKLQKQTQIASQATEKLNALKSEQQIAEPTSPTSPAGAGLALPDISGKNTRLNDSTLGGQVSPSKTTQNAFLLPGVNPQSTLLAGNMGRMAATGTAFYEKQKADAQAERLIHSVNAVTELLKANTELRENVEKVERDLDNKDAENTQLEIENQQLRERLELVEGILKANSHHLESMLSSKVKSDIAMSNTEHGKFFKDGQAQSQLASMNQKLNSGDNQPMTTQESEQVADSSQQREGEGASGQVDQVYNELIHMRKMNRVLGQRIKQLEVQNFHMTSQGFNQSGIKQQEPSRPIFSGGYDATDSPQRINSYGPSRNEFETPAQHHQVPEEGAPQMIDYGEETRGYEQMPQSPNEQQLMLQPGQVKRHMQGQGQNGGAPPAQRYYQVGIMQGRNDQNMMNQYQNAPMTGTNPRVVDSQNLLPRPHHNFGHMTGTKFNQAQSEFKTISGYQTDFVSQKNNGKGLAARHTIGLPGSNYQKSRSTIKESTGKKSYQPVPDGRFYTKANFFTLADRQQAEQLMSSNDDPLENVDIRQNFRSVNQSVNQGLQHTEEVPFPPQQHYTNGTGEGARPSRVTLQPISESKRVMSNPSRGARGQSVEPFEHAQHLPQHHQYEQQLHQQQQMMPMHGHYETIQTTNINNISANYLNQISVNHSQVKPRLSGGTGKKIKKNGNVANGGNPMANSSNLSMVLVMNNMNPRRKQVQAKSVQKRGNSSSNRMGNQRVQNDFYF